MADSKLIVIEGAQGAGKTTITDYIRYSLSCTNLYRLSGTRDSSPTGLEKSISMYEILLDYIKKLENLKNINYETLLKIKGIGKVKAIELLAITELSKRIYYDLNSSKKDKYQTPEIIYQKTKHLFRDLKQEHFYCLYLNSKKELIERKLLFMGTLNKSVVHPREIFKEAYNLSASSIVCLHNHPSGDPTPSSDDIMLTNSLMKIGQINQIPIIDHIIIGNNDYYSFYENNRKMRNL